MSMNNTIKIIIFSLILLCCFNRTVYAIDICTSFHDEKHCLAYGQCKWKNSTCTATFVAEDACDENAIRKVLQFFGYLLLIAKVAVPLLIIGFATFDLFKAVIDKDEKSFSKKVKSVIIRIVSGLIVFFIPSIIYAIFSLSDKLDVVDTSQYQTCANCLLKPTECEVED